MEDVLTDISPPSRFFQEDLDNFATPSPPLPSPFLLLNPNPNPNLLRPSLLVIAISAPSISLLHRIPNKSLIGTLILPEIPLSGNCLAPSARDRSCNIYAVDGPASSRPAVLVSVQYPVPAERSRAVAKSLLGEIRAETVLILDSIRSQNYRETLAVDEALAFKLETSEQRRGGDPAVVRGVEHLPSGSVMDGLGAAILGECQMRRAKGTLLATWPDNGRPPVAPLLRSLLQDLGFEVGGAEVEENFAGFGASARYDSDLYT
ncbi:Fatty acid desaturase (Delta-4 desaturase) [Cocos nucifera]|uniref:Fatty acid desaturase (Delta-4 desaturase) n=1 Tax=Cocos nucifera TaxID=13894 RepID=A0A8K0MZN5_COCNU|nr:Fatty acid desaturase (Delta-4 desaturase) [Cocos nucifera]